MLPATARKRFREGPGMERISYHGLWRWGFAAICPPMPPGDSPPAQDTSPAPIVDLLGARVGAHLRFYLALVVTTVTCVMASIASMFGLLMPKKLGRRWMLYMPVLWSKCILWASRCPLEITFHEPLPEGGYLVFANHQSILDITGIFLAMQEKPVAFAAKRELFSLPFL